MYLEKHFSRGLILEPLIKMLSPTQVKRVFREFLIEYPQYQTAINNNRDLAPTERHLNLSIDQLTKFDEDLYKNPSQFVKIIEEGIRELNGNAHIQVILNVDPDNLFRDSIQRRVTVAGGSEGGKWA